MNLKFDSISVYQTPLAEAISGAASFETVRCDPKLTVGSEIVLNVPVPSSTETFNDWLEALMGKLASGKVSASWSRFKTAA